MNKNLNKHILCLYYRDIIFSMLIEMQKINKNGERFEIKAVEDEIFDNILDLLNKYDKTLLSKVLTKDISVRLIEEFIIYINEILSNLYRGNLTIACDLLRKAFKDYLHYLEWLSYDNSEITQLIYQGKVDEYAICRTGMSRQKLKDMLTELTSKNELLKMINILDGEILYNIRYNYNSEYSLERIWNKANHLVTTKPQIKTTDFNFLYLNNTDYHNYYDYLYGKLIPLLIYTISIIERLFNDYFNELRTEIKYLNHRLIKCKTDYFYDINYDFSKIKIVIPCEKCSRFIILSENQKKGFVENKKVYCNKCNNELFYNKYFFI